MNRKISNKNNGEENRIRHQFGGRAITKPRKKESESQNRKRNGRLRAHQPSDAHESHSKLYLLNRKPKRIYKLSGTFYFRFHCPCQYPIHDIKKKRRKCACVCVFCVCILYGDHSRIMSQINNGIKSNEVQNSKHYSISLIAYRKVFPSHFHIESWSKAVHVFNISFIIRYDLFKLRTNKHKPNGILNSIRVDKDFK